MIRVRWPNGVICPRCQCEKLWRTGHRLICSACR
ncbi:MAG: transposase, partial [Deltaproteobacteria bacterium]|nr:transposase [Deltaproteobacteria bacterium]